MELRLIVCDGSDAAGTPCGQIARILETRQILVASGSRDDVERETHHEIECPKCGRRTQVVAGTTSSDGA